MANFPKTFLLASYARIQYARDDEGPYFRIKQNNNIDNDLYCSSNEFPNHLALLTMARLKARYRIFIHTHALDSRYLL